jgi:flagellar basal-body rod protein FlgG
LARFLQNTLDFNRARKNMYGIIRTGMATAMHEIAVVSNNIANSGSTGFKKSDVSFADIYGSATPDTVARTTTGFGSSISDTRRNDGQGTVVTRAGALNMALVGPGLFAISPPDETGGASEGMLFTRNGEFSLDKEGFLRSADGSFVRGLVGGEEGSTLETIQIPFSLEGENMSQLEVGSDGLISATYGNKTVVESGQLAVVNFSNQGGLRNVGSARFAQSSQSGDPIFGVGGQSGFGTIQTGALEGSNVDITQEMTVMIRAQQQFSGSARVLQANSDMVEKLTR